MSSRASVCEVPLGLGSLLALVCRLAAGLTAGLRSLDVLTGLCLCVRLGFCCLLAPAVCRAACNKVDRWVLGPRYPPGPVSGRFILASVPCWPLSPSKTYGWAARRGFPLSSGT